MVNQITAVTTDFLQCNIGLANGVSLGWGYLFVQSIVCFKVSKCGGIFLLATRGPGQQNDSYR